jgi:hypothetical protein
VTLNFATWDDEVTLIGCLKDDALGHATTVHPLMRTFDEHGWLIGGLKVIAEGHRHRAALPKGTEHCAWTMFRPDKQALLELGDLVERKALCLPTGLRVRLRKRARRLSMSRTGGRVEHSSCHKLRRRACSCNPP